MHDKTRNEVKHIYTQIAKSHSICTFARSSLRVYTSAISVILRYSTIVIFAFTLDNHKAQHIQNPPITQ